MCFITIKHYHKLCTRWGWVTFFLPLNFAAMLEHTGLIQACYTQPPSGGPRGETEEGKNLVVTSKGNIKSITLNSGYMRGQHDIFPQIIL